jgi:predicted nucleic acid-binding protein
VAFVLDASVTVAWGLEGKDDAVADLVLQQMSFESAHVPEIWWFEVGNVLLINERRRRISEKDTATFLRALSTMNIEIDHAPDQRGTLTLARSHKLTVYDASYLELALRRNVPLATLDKKLALAASDEGVHLIG